MNRAREVDDVQRRGCCDGCWWIIWRWAMGVAVVACVAPPKKIPRVSPHFLSFGEGNHPTHSHKYEVEGSKQVDVVGGAAHRAAPRPKYRWWRRPSPVQKFGM